MEDYDIETKYRLSVRDLQAEYNNKKEEMDRAFNSDVKKLWVEKIMVTPAIHGIRIKIEFEVEGGYTEQEMYFEKSNLSIVAPLLNMRAMDIYELGKVGTEKA